MGEWGRESSLCSCRYVRKASLSQPVIRVAKSQGRGFLVLDATRPGSPGHCSNCRPVLSHCSIFYHTRQLERVWGKEEQREGCEEEPPLL